jgi:LysM repeat protein
MTIKKNTNLRRAGLVGGTAALALVAGNTLAAAPASAASTTVWDKVAQCESGGDWSINTGNGYYGGLQFSASTWKDYGGTGLASNASKSTQIAVAKKVLAAQGSGAWPVCSVKAGLTQANGGAASTADSATSSTSSTTTGAAAQQSTAQQSSTQGSTAKHAATTGQASTADTSTAQSSTAVSTGAKGSGTFVTVKSGDTLAKIASANGVSSWRDLYSVNSVGVSDPNLILVGQKLELPAA